MYSNEFEKAFSDFLDCQEYDQAEKHFIYYSASCLYCRMEIGPRKPAQATEDIPDHAKGRYGTNA